MHFQQAVADLLQELEIMLEEVKAAVDKKKLRNRLKN